jgi:hypothetical protein
MKELNHEVCFKHLRVYEDVKGSVRVNVRPNVEKGEGILRWYSDMLD